MDEQNPAEPEEIWVVVYDGWPVWVELFDSEDAARASVVTYAIEDLDSGDGTPVQAQQLLDGLRRATEKFEIDALLDEYYSYGDKNVYITQAVDRRSRAT